MKEYELYRAYYCGLCKTIERIAGQIPRLALSYDAVFLAMVLASTEDHKEELEFYRCPLHPVKKRIIVKKGKSLDYAADMMVLLALFKIKDDIQDDNSIKARMALLGLTPAAKIVMKRHNKKCIMIEERLKVLSELEKAKNPSPDQASEPFARMLAEIFDWKNEDDENFSLQTGTKESICLKKIGYHLGKWIYLIDAYDDITEDQRKNSYNSLIYQYKENNGKEEKAEKIKKEIKDRVRFNLMMHLSALGDAWEELSLRQNKELIENIIYSGLAKKTESVLEEEKQEDGKSL